MNSNGIHQWQILKNHGNIFGCNWPTDWAMLWVLISTVHLAMYVLIMSLTCFSVNSHFVFLFYWVFVYELSGCGFESRCSHLNFRYRACFEQGIPWHLGNYRVWIPSEIHRRHNKNIQSIFLTFICLLDQTTKQPLSNLVAYKTKINVLWFHSKIFTSRTCKNKTTSFDVLIYFLKKAKYASWWLLDFLQIKVFQYLTVLIFSEILRAQIHYFNCITK